MDISCHRRDRVRVLAAVPNGGLAGARRPCTRASTVADPRLPEQRGSVHDEPDRALVAEANGPPAQADPAGGVSGSGQTAGLERRRRLRVRGQRRSDGGVRRASVDDPARQCGRLPHPGSVHGVARRERRHAGEPIIVAASRVLLDPARRRGPNRRPAGRPGACPRSRVPRRPRRLRPCGPRVPLSVQGGRRIRERNAQRHRWRDLSFSGSAAVVYHLGTRQASAAESGTR
jgi:hypothetical protein